MGEAKYDYIVVGGSCNSSSGIRFPLIRAMSGGGVSITRI